MSKLINKLAGNVFIRGAEGGVKSIQPLPPRHILKKSLRTSDFHLSTKREGDACQNYQEKPADTDE